MKLAYPIIRSLEDGHQQLGPACVDRVGIDAYKAAMARMARPLWRIEGFVWVAIKDPPLGWGLFAEIVEPEPSRTLNVLLRRSK